MAENTSALELISEDAPVLPILKDGAIIRIATSLWNYRIQHEKPTDVFTLYKPFSMDDIPLPSSLKETLNGCLKFMSEEIGKWLRIQTANVITEKMYGSYDNAIPFLRNLVWKCDGTVDYIETDRRLRADPMLLEFKKVKTEELDFFKQIDENEELSNSIEDPYYADDFDDFF